MPRGVRGPAVTPITVFVIGATNTGKSFLLDSVRRHPDCGVIEVGKEMRRRYPPSHFQGQAAPAHTAEEAWQVYLDGMTENAKKALIWCDGQPRDLIRTERILALNPEKYPRLFIHLWASKAVRENRARGRDGSDPEKLALAMARLDADLPPLYDVLSRLLIAQETVLTYGTNFAFNPEKLVTDIWQGTVEARALLKG